MKINEIKSAVGLERIKPQETPPQPSGAPATPTGEPRDRVTVGASRTTDISFASARRAAGSERSAHLDRLETQVRSGTYTVDPSRVAEQILSDAEVDARLQAMRAR